MKGIYMLHVITGPPGAGKSSYIKAHAKPLPSMSVPSLKQLFPSPQ
ncbi:hypothetical protein ACFU9X_15795 [Streptomyces atratus]